MANNALRVDELCFALNGLTAIAEERALPGSAIEATRMRRTTQSGRIDKATASDCDSTAIICPYITKTVPIYFAQLRRNICITNKCRL